MIQEFASIPTLLQHRLRTDEDPAALQLMNQLEHVKSVGYFTREEFLPMCRWKSFRPRRLHESNTNKHIIEVSRQALAEEEEDRRMMLLISLRGVGIPTASAILTLIDPKAYGVLDIRVWKLLYLYGSVKTKPNGIGFSLKDWRDYLSKIRDWADELQVKTRYVERTLFEYQKEIQEGSLYS